jgi:transcriptional regulator with XRE-family HTH domain
MPRLAPKLPGLAGWRPWRRRSAGGEHGSGAAEDPLLEAGRRLRQEREQRGLSLRQLALETRISTPVLEALERGWRDRLPEAAYLRTMLPLIEQRLELPSGSLEVALPPQSGGGAGRERDRGGLLKRFTPGSIEVFSTWQGTLLYGGLTLGLIYGINLQQQQLAAANVLTLQPIAPLPSREQARPADAGSALLRIYPDLRPLQRASQGVALAALQQPRHPAAPSGPGVLQLKLSRPSRVALSSDGGPRTNLEGAQGELVMTLQPPLQLSITPAPAAAEVLWNSQPLSALAGQPGRYRLPQPEVRPKAAPSPQPEAQAQAPAAQRP